jgi:Helicase conserved C-terminal domain
MTASAIPPATNRPVSPDTMLKQRVVETMWRHVVDDATGASEPAWQRYVGPAPAGRFWLGTLASPDDLDTGRRDQASLDRFRPAAQGFRFRVPSLPVELDLTVAFVLWVVLHPTYDEQRAGAGLEDADKEADSDTDDRRGGDPRVELARVRMKVPIGDVRLKIPVDEPGQRTIGRAQISSAIDQAFRRLPAGMMLHRPLRRGGSRPRQSDLHDPASWHAWEQENLDHPARPDWLADIDIETRRVEDPACYELLVTVVNRSPGHDGQYVDEDRTRGFVSWACDPNLYEVRLGALVRSDIEPYELAQIPDSYRYNRKIRVLGWNAAAEEPEPERFVTAYAAVSQTDRIYAREQATDSRTELDTRFRTLSADPLPALRHLVAEAEAWTRMAWGEEALKQMADEGRWDGRMKQQANEDADAARAELAWVKAGLDLLAQDGDLLRAFRLMNETMESTARERYDRWRPFQLAFILGCLPALADPARAATVDILWFPTGGGKTEAYLGLNALYLFYGRLKGRTGGAQSWARFPLRLLSLQQTQRFADSVLLAETVRRDHPDLRGGEPFGLGYFIGSGNTPNRVMLPSDKYYDGWDPFNRRNAESCRVLERCPACGTKPTVSFDPDTYTMEHRCPNGSCDLGGDERLPVYVIDDDIYRRAPSVLVGTVDKLAQLSWNNGFRHLLGRAHGRCPRHGLASRPFRCSIWGCDLALQPMQDGFDGLALEIQDELHLLSESLGALNGNYETLFQAIAEACGRPPLRIIGSTATIEGYREQSDQLYRRPPRRFPVPGPRKTESFWAFENRDDPLRTYVAMLPRGTTMINAAYQITLSHRRFLNKGLQDPRQLCNEVLRIDPVQADAVAAYLRELYEVFVGYALQKQELERYHKDVAEAQEICPTEAAWDEVTGDVDFYDIRDVLNRLEHPPDSPNHRIRVLGATSAIAHGVDIDRLNVMCVMGMPTQTSEFIQVTARVGRTHPGLVFCLINPMRERDVSHFRYFSKYAEYLDRLVEHVPVNRESLPVLERVLPGGFMAWLLQVDEPRWLAGGGRASRRKRLWQAKSAAVAIDGGFLAEADMIERLRRSFAIEPAAPRFRLHEEKIRRFVEGTLRDLQLARGRDDATHEILKPNPPSSLRDVETAITVRGER